MWASDWPYLRAVERQDYGPLVRLVELLFPDPDDRRALFWEYPESAVRLRRASGAFMTTSLPGPRGKRDALTLRQIEVIRAIMVTGTIVGAAKLLNVSAPGISRLMKYTEDMLGVRLFNRRHGRYVPTPEARNIFDLLDSIYRKVEDLQFAIDRLGKGEGRELSFASVPSIANVMVPRAVERLRRQFPELGIDINILKIEEAIDYLLLARGEVVAISARFDHSIIDFAPLATGRLLCIVPLDSELAERTSIRPAGDRRAHADRNRSERSLRAHHDRDLPPRGA